MAGVGGNGGVQHGDKQNAGRRDGALLKGSRLCSEWEGGGTLAAEADWGCVCGGALHWFNATAEAAVKRGLPFFPRSVRRRSPASACKGQVTFLIYTPSLPTHNTNPQLIYFMHAHRQTHNCMHTDSQTGKGVGAAAERERERVL